MSNQFGLLKTRRFLPFFLTQFLGALNDNVFKQAMVIFLTFHAASLSDLPLPALLNLCAGLFILPFFLFSATAGQLADKYDRAMLARLSKVIEIAVMGLGAIGFVAASLPALVLALFLMGTQSTLFGPVKYAYLPQHLNDGELVGGNGLVESATFVAILLGQILGAWLVGVTDAWGLSAAVLLLAIAGWWTSRGIPHSPAPPLD